MCAQAAEGIVAAAGAVVLRGGTSKTEVLVVHRPKYDDWTLPKGKLDPGEGPREAAVREVLEETGVQVRLGPPLGQQRYDLGEGRGTKLVHYWVGVPTTDPDVSAYTVNDEIDEVRWVATSKAPDLLTYRRDRATLAEAEQHARKAQVLVVVRHAETVDRSKWDGKDGKRPLDGTGERQAEALPPVLNAYGVQRLVSSSSRRGWTTLAPYGVHAGLEVEVTDALTEEAATREQLADEANDLLGTLEPTAVCTHRKVLPTFLEELGLDPVPLDKAAMLVMHHRGGEVVALEHVPAPTG